jgi:hypothetical protein
MEKLTVEKARLEAEIEVFIQRLIALQQGE